MCTLCCACTRIHTYTRFPCHTHNSRTHAEELENPINVHRWRKLAGSDPATYEMIQKIQTLQKRLIAKTEEVRGGGGGVLCTVAISGLIVVFVAALGAFLFEYVSVRVVCVCVCV